MLSHNLKPWRGKMWVVPGLDDDNSQVEDFPEVQARPHDRQEPGSGSGGLSLGKKLAFPG